MKWQHDEAVESPSLATGSPESVQDPRNEELLAEARILRQHKSRLETRMQILEDHNKQLESQLHRLRELLLQVRSEQAWGGLCHSRAVTMAQRGWAEKGKPRAEGHDSLPTTTLLTPASSRVRRQWFSSLLLGFISTSVRRQPGKGERAQHP